MSPANRIAHLSATGAAVYGIAPQSQPVARMGITTHGKLWYQLGDKPHVAGDAAAMQEDGAGWRWPKGEGAEGSLYFVQPEDADDWELGEMITALGAGREIATEEQCLEMLGDDR